MSFFAGANLVIFFIIWLFRADFESLFKTKSLEWMWL